MSEVRTLIKTIISYRPNAKPSEIVTLLNNIIYNDLERMEYIITLLYMRFNFKTKEVLYSNAGHTRPTLYRIDNISEIREGDILIGALKDYKYNDYMLPLFKDDIFCYTPMALLNLKMRWEIFWRREIVKLCKTIS